jgi:hypothetical protein
MRVRRPPASARATIDERARRGPVVDLGEQRSDRAGHAHGIVIATASRTSP